MRASLLRSTAEDFCQKFVSGASPDTILDADFSTSAPRITEHGPTWAAGHLPYLAHTFHGRRHGQPSTASNGQTPSTDPLATGHPLSCEDYFDALASTLAFHPQGDSIPAPEHFIVDPGNESGGHGGSVVVKAKCKLSSVATGAVWEEVFVFLFCDFGKDGRIGHLEIWSDSLSAWAAVTKPQQAN